jgi:CheY-like chemotaxis protein
MAAAHTILCVDDEPNILNALRRLFRREGHQVLTATGGQEGLELLRQKPVALIISDQRMPGMIGAEFLARSRALSPHSMRILLTGYSDMEAAVQAINQGGIHLYLTKPWDDEQLKMAVRQVLARFELEQRNRELTEELQEKNARLERFNAELEERVRERTHELQLKVKELGGKDRIAQHLLTVHPLEETLELVLEVAAQVLELDRAIIYLTEGEHLRPAAGIGLAAPGAFASPAELEALDLDPVQRQVFAQVHERRQPVNVKDLYLPPFAVVPILRGQDLLGCVAADNHRRNQVVSDEEVQTLSSFALQVAVAIHDARLHQDFGRWKEELGSVLAQVDELDDLSASL